MPYIPFFKPLSEYKFHFNNMNPFVIEGHGGENCFQGKEDAKQSKTKTKENKLVPEI